MLTDAFHNPSRIKFQVERDALYTFQVKNAAFDGFIKLLLRTYSGLFSQFVKIDESTLARRSALTSEKVKAYLQTLSKRQIIHYIPRREIPVITFLEERLDDKNLLINPERYYFRKARYKKRIREMLRYASSVDICRNQFLLSYFGQLDTPRCGRCDVCMDPGQLQAGSEEFDSIVQAISEQLSGQDLLLEDLAERTGLDPEKISQVAEWMNDQDMIQRKKDLSLKWKG